MEARKCAICGNEFMPKNGSAKYCSDECKRKGARLREQAKKPKKKDRALIDISKEAKAHGMSYGKYVAYMQKG